MNKFIFKITQVILTFLRAFFAFLNGGQKCIVCSEKTFTVPVCKTCSQRYFSVKNILNENRCTKCGKKLISTKGLCSECRENVVLQNVDKMYPLFSYLMWNKEVLFLWKISGVRSLSSFFAKKVSEVLQLIGVHYIVPVPPRPGKIKKNGWDQVDELCSFLEYNYHFCRLNLLERVSKTQQKKLNRKNRLETIDSAYILKKYDGVLPEEVCIIDDVCTTGATIEKCAQLIKSKGVKRVDALTLFAV